MSSQRRRLWRCNIWDRSLTEVREQSKWMSGGVQYAVEKEKLLSDSWSKTWVVYSICFKEANRVQLGGREGKKSVRNEIGEVVGSHVTGRASCFIYRWWKAFDRFVQDKIFVLKGSLVTTWGMNYRGRKWRQGHVGGHLTLARSEETVTWTGCWQWRGWESEWTWAMFGGYASRICWSIFWPPCFILTFSKHRNNDKWAIFFKNQRNI